jgi:hypothetical protein
LPQLRISLTISGAISLGAYEGGALAALLYAARAIASGDDPPLRIDVMSGASAGSITALLSARALLQGHDPRAVLYGAWVASDSIGNLLAHGTQAPLSIDALRKVGRSLLDPAAQDPSPHRQSASIRLSYTLACLRGFDYRLPRLGREPVQSMTFVDTYDHVLAPDAAIESLLTPVAAAPLDAALASAANELGFPPCLLNRDAQWQAYREQGIDNLPPGESHSLWFTDGGTIANEPLGQTLTMANEADADADSASSDRLHLLIHPAPAAAALDDAWADPQVQPTFTQTAIRGLEMQRTQSLYADLKQLEKTNSHLRWVGLLHSELGPVLDRLPAESKALVTTALENAAAAIAAGRDDLTRQRTARPDAGGHAAAAMSAAAASPSERLLETLQAAAGLTGKSPARVDVISPLLLPEAATHSVDQLLSGEVLFHFGGFLDQQARHNDFDLGYASTLEWLSQGGLTSAGLPAGHADRALTAAEAAYQPQDGWKTTGSRTAGTLLALHPWQTAALAGKLTQVLLHDLIHHPRP